MTKCKYYKTCNKYDKESITCNKESSRGCFGKYEENTACYFKIKSENKEIKRLKEKLK